jgi:peptidoglycan/xylan/chitin deacetylase (PgdA/CDA1 family)
MPTRDNQIERRDNNGTQSKRHSLERLLSPHEVFPILDEAGAGEPTWLRANGWRLFARPLICDSEVGEPVEVFRLSDSRVVNASLLDAPRAVRVPFSFAEAHENLVSERWRAGTLRRGLTSDQLSLYYRVKRFIPRRVQLIARRALIRRQRLPDFPAWPLEESLDKLLRFYARCLLLAGGKRELAFDWFWPASFRAALILTHDVESAEGLPLAIELADLEEERGFRSSFNIVVRWYPIDKGILRELLERGFELGVHGVYHDRSMFSSRTAFESQLPIVRQMAARIGAAGFRSPATHRVFEWLADLPLDYDCSVPHSDPFEPVPGGCCSLWPFFIGEIVELPYTLPQDHTLFSLLSHRSISLWQDQLERIQSLHGLVELLTHPDPGYLGDRAKRDLYVEFLDAIRERPGLWKPLPREVAEWWRQRDAHGEGPWPTTVGRAWLDEATGEVQLEPQAAYR